jgi:hypothetical protein
MRNRRLRQWVTVSADLQALPLRWGRDDAVQAHVINDLAVMIGDVPDGDSRYAQLGVRAAVAAFDAVHRVLRIDGGEDFVAVVEGIAQVFQKLRLGLRRRGPAFLAAVRGSLAFDLVEAQATCLTCSAKERTPSNLPPGALGI